MTWMRRRNQEIETKIQNVIVGANSESEDGQSEIWSANLRKWVLLKSKCFNFSLCLPFGDAGHGLLCVAKLSFLLLQILLTTPLEGLRSKLRRFWCYAEISLPPWHTPVLATFDAYLTGSRVIHPGPTGMTPQPVQPRRLPIKAMLPFTSWLSREDHQGHQWF